MVADTPDGAQQVTHSIGYRRYALWLLMGIYTINFLDRQVLNSLIEPIKHDLKLLDWQLGALSGLAFAVLYTLLGIPIARLAEWWNRPVIIGVSVAIWSGFTALCGTAQTFTQLIAYRIGVGFGEAGSTPPSHSLISEITPRERRASALAFMHLGTPLGSLLGLAIGGLVADRYGWRWAFAAAGAPGLLFAILALTTLKEPRRALARRTAEIRAASATFGETFKLLLGKKTFWLVSLAAACKAFVGYGHAPFNISFFLRNHGQELAAMAGHFGLGSLGFVATALGLTHALGGVCGALAGGALADRFGARSPSGYLIVAVFSSLATVPLFILAVSVPTALPALAVLILTFFFAAVWYGPVYVTVQSIVPPHMRATASAMLFFLMNVIGLGLGPVMVGAASDIFQALHLTGSGVTLEGCRTGAQANQAACAAAAAWGVQQALIYSTLVGGISVILFWIACKTIKKDIES